MLKRFLLMLLVCIPLVGCDQITKMQATEHLMGQAPLSFFNNIFRLEYATNTGGWGGLFGQLPDTLRYLVLIGFVGLFLLALSGYILFKKQSDVQTIALSLVLAGGLGNVIDRVLYGYVVDFLNVGIGAVRTNIFNVADMVALAGIGLYLWLQFRAPAEQDDSVTA